MPELPEVETIKLELNKLIAGKKIKSVDINLPKQVQGDRKKFLKVVAGAKVRAVRRRAKIIIFDLANGWHLIFHLKLTGQLIYQGHQEKSGKNQGVLPNKYSHVIFNFSDGSKLFFNDLRQFGWVRLVADKELEKINAEFGPEPLDKNFTFEKFKNILSKKKSVIKVLLMDQSFLAGIGNIYAQEALFCAGIKPTRPAHKISEHELRKLYNCLRQILKLAIGKKGTSADNYVDAFGREGKMINYLKVYGRLGEKCKRCRAILKQIKQGARSTVYCGECQK